MGSAARRRKTAIESPPNRVVELQRALDLSDNELAFLLDANPRTVYRWSQEGPPAGVAPLDRLEELLVLARKSLREEALAEWFHERNRALGGSIPIRLAADPRGLDVVRNLLWQAAYGLPL